MKLTADTAVLAPAAAFAARYASRPGGSSLPGLAGVQLEAHHDHLLLRAYGHEAAGSVRLPIGADEPGEALVPGAMLAEILRALPSGQVGLSDRGGPGGPGGPGGMVQLTGGDERTGAISFTLPTMPTAQQPDPPAMPASAGSVRTEAFLDAVRRLSRIAARDDLVPLLTGMLLRLSPGGLTVAATDRYRVGVCELPWLDAPPTTQDVVVPARTLSDTVTGLFPTGTLHLGVGGVLQEGNARDPGDEASTADQTVLGIRCDANDQVRSAVLRLLDGRFPPLHPRNAATDQENLGTLTVDGEQLRSAVDRVCLVADRLAAVQLTIEPGHLTVHASGSTAAVGRQVLPAELEGAGTTVAYNAGYLRDGLELVGGRRVRLSFNQGTRTASLLTSPDRPGYRYLVMPRRLPDAVPAA